MKINPFAVLIMWALTLLMVAAIALGPVYILSVAAVVILYTVVAVVVS